MNVIVHVGISTHIFVHFQYKLIWLTKTYVLTEEEKNKLKRIQQGDSNDDDSDMSE